MTVLLFGCSTPQKSLTLEEQKENKEKVRKIVEEKLRPFYLYGVAANDYKYKNGAWPSSHETLKKHALQLHSELTNFSLKVTSVNELNTNIFNIKLHIQRIREDKSIFSMPFILQVKNTNSPDKPVMKLSFDTEALKDKLEKHSKPKSRTFLPELLIGMALAKSFNSVHTLQPFSLSGSTAKSKEEMKTKMEHLFKE